MRRMIFLLAACGLVQAQTVINGNRVILGSWDASGSASVKPVKTGASLPGTCGAGEVFFNTNADPGKNLYLCASTNTWSTVIASSGLVSTFGVSLDGGGVALTTGQKGYLTIPYACTITGWSLQADQPGTLQIEIDKKAGALPSSGADKITAVAPPSLTSTQLRIASCAGGDCTGWTTAVATNDVVGYSVTAANTVTRATLVVGCQR